MSVLPKMTIEEIADELVDFSKSQKRRGNLSTDSLTLQSRNPLCGDVVQLALSLKNGVVNDARHDGQGCVVSQGAMAMLCENIIGKRTDEILIESSEDLLSFDPTLLSMSRQRCALLSVETLKELLGSVAGENYTTPDVASKTLEPVAAKRVRKKKDPNSNGRRKKSPSSNKEPRNNSTIESKHPTTNSAIELQPQQRLKETFDAAYCVNLDRRADRWESFLKRVPEDWPFCEVTRVAAIDGRKVPHPNWWRPGGGAWGCYRTHLSILEQALNQGLNSILLLEDDALFGEDFTNRAAEFMNALPDDWGMVYLGGQHLYVNKHPPQRINDLVFRPYNVNRTHAYALRGEMMATVYRHLCRVDWENKHHIDHHLGLLHQQQKDPIYCPKTWLVGQTEDKSNICGKTTPERFWSNAFDIEKTNPNDQLFVAILGLHSSGSSCLAGVLYHLGLHLGNKLTGYYGNDPQKNKCGYEAIGLRQLCEKAVPFPTIEYNLPRHKIWNRLKHWINEKRREAASNQTIAAGKYPQLCRMGKQLINVCGDNLRVIVSDRDIDKSIKSLQRRCPKIAPEVIEAHQIWLEEGKQWTLSQLKPEQYLHVPYDNLVENPLQETERITEFLELNPSESQLAAINSWVNEGKRHIS